MKAGGMRRLSVAFILVAYTVGCAQPIAGNDEHLSPPALVLHDGGLAERTTCSLETTMPFLLDREGVLFAFDPLARSFTQVTTLRCPFDDMSFNSMAVDRNGIAWVNAVEWKNEKPVAGELFRASTVDGECQPTGLPLTDQWARIGMGFSAASREEPEVLYVAGGGATSCTDTAASSGLGWIDPAAPGVVPIGQFPDEFSGYGVELSGTGEGNLYGLLAGPAPAIATIDMISGLASVVVASLPGIGCPIEYAVSFWGGALYVFTSRHSGVHSRVTRYSLADGTLDTEYVPDTGLEIIGAGVSTCAPTTEPR
jgi:hypothetical protein